MLRSGKYLVDGQGVCSSVSLLVLSYTTVYVLCFTLFCVVLGGCQLFFISGSMSVSDSSTHSSINNNLNLVSWNVKGLGHVIKRGRVFSHLKSVKPDIIFHQETHIGVNERRRLRANWISQVFQAPFTCKARGVAIVFRKNILPRLYEGRPIW